MNFLKNLFKKKQGQAMGLGSAGGLVTTLVIVAITAGIGLLVLSGVQDSITNANASSALGDGISAVTNFVGLMPVLGTVFIAAILLGAIGLFVFNRMR